ncbi:site-specific integrase [Ruegeria arenilitoris]|uniref:site-specific integrase n=1 Tax=Ruegeria arenilitoris TaxID=1173585 RepID=UPI00147F4249|nr:site-specific integrase [Ruegeria arenilitoris]
MPRHRLSMAPSDWPGDIRTQFEEVFSSVSKHQRRRLEQGLGRWLLEADRDDLPPELITPALVESRLGHLRPEIVAAVKQALQAVYPEAAVFVRENKVEVESKRKALEREIDRNWHRLPPAWQEAARPKLHFCSEGLNDGILVEAWTSDTLQSRLQTVWSFFDFCRAEALEEEITRNTVQRRLDARQAEFRAGHFSLATIHGEIQRLKMLGMAMFRDRDWTWLDPVLRVLKKKVALQPSRSDARLVDLAELRQAAISCSEVALRHHKAGVGCRAKTTANKMARTGLAISLLVNSPIRRESLATLDLKENFDANFTRLFLSPHETKDKKRDERILTPEVRKQLQDYVAHHRASVAPHRETALFVGSRGKPVAPAYLSQTVGDQCQKLFGKRVTPQVIRNIIAGFIVSQVPEKASLASVVLNHASIATTETYRANGKQVQAAKKLREANDQGRSDHGVNQSPLEQPEKRGSSRKCRTRPVRRPRGRLSDPTQTGRAPI